MEIIIGGVAILLIGLYLYFNSTKYLLNKAHKSLESNDRDSAKKRFKHLRLKSYEASIEYLKLAQEDINKLPDDDARINSLVTLIAEPVFKKAAPDNRLEAIVNSGRNQLFEEAIKLFKRDMKKHDLDKATGSLARAKKFTTSGDQQDTCKNAYRLLLNDVYASGVKAECSDGYALAEEIYGKTLQLLREVTMVSGEETKVTARLAISQLKQNKNLDAATIKSLGKQDGTKETTDALYRQALSFAKAGEITEAKSIIDAYLAKVDNQALESLKTFVSNYQEIMGNISARLLNKNLKSKTPAALNKLLKNLTSYENNVIAIRPEEKQKFKNLPSYLRSRLVAMYFERQEFGKVVRLITSQPDFYRSPDLLKNVGVACFGIANREGGLTARNYQQVISLWLAAVYSDAVINHSLEATSWDDAYTFTLRNSLGETTVDDLELAQNINFDSPDKNNISIGKTQTRLLQEFEKLIHTLPESKFNKRIQDFYSEQAVALKELIQLTGYLPVYASPYLSEEYGLTQQTFKRVQTQNAEAYENNFEAIIEYVLPYVNDSAPAEFRQYKYAKELLAETMQLIRRKKKVGFSTKTLQQIKATLNVRRNIRQSYETQLTSLLSSDEVDIKASLLLNYFKEIKKILPDSDIVSHFQAEAILDWTIDEVNGETMSNGDALAHLIEANSISSGNSRLLKNMGTMVRMNCMDYIGDSISRSGLNALNKLKNSGDATIYVYLKSAVTPFLMGLIKQIIQNDSSSGQLLIYKAGIRLTDYSPPLFGSSLNENGEDFARKIRFINEFAKL